MPKKRWQIVMDDDSIERNLNSSGGYSSHYTTAVVASEKFSISPSAFTFAKKMASTF